MKYVLLPTLAASLALCAPAFAQSSSGSSSTQAPPAMTGSQTQDNSATRANNLLTINKMKQDLQKAGFTDIQVLSDSFVVQAKDKEGNPTVMSLSPSGVFAISALQNTSQQAKAGSNSSSQNEMRR